MSRRLDRMFVMRPNGHHEALRGCADVWGGGWPPDRPTSSPPLCIFLKKSDGAKNPSTTTLPDGQVEGE